jgi:hypothetical protein
VGGARRAIGALCREGAICQAGGFWQPVSHSPASCYPFAARLQTELAADYNNKRPREEDEVDGEGPEKKRASAGTLDNGVGDVDPAGVRAGLPGRNWGRSGRPRPRQG